MINTIQIDKHHPEFAGEHPSVPWEDLYWMRNRVSHGYFSIDLEVIWNTIQRDIPELEQQTKGVLQQLIQKSSSQFKS